LIDLCQRAKHSTTCIMIIAAAGAGDLLVYRLPYLCNKLHNLMIFPLLGAMALVLQVMVAAPIPYINAATPA
jgi:hypothetical protein